MKTRLSKYVNIVEAAESLGPRKLKSVPGGGSENPDAQYSGNGYRIFRKAELVKFAT